MGHVLYRALVTHLYIVHSLIVTFQALLHEDLDRTEIRHIHTMGQSY